MNLPEGIAIGSFVLGTLGFMYKMSQDVAEIRKQVTNDIKHIETEEATKRGRVYERLDEIKKQAEDKFTHKDVCQVIHGSVDRQLKEIALDVKTILRNGKKESH